MKRKSCEISEFTRGEICGMKRFKMTNREIAKELGVKEGVVQYTLAKVTKYGTAETRSRSGRPRKTNHLVDLSIKKHVGLSPEISSSEIAKELNSVREVKISPTTVRRRLNFLGINSRVKAKKPFISVVNRRKRLAFAKLHRNWSVADWSRVLWTDESKFNALSNDSKSRRVWRRQGERMNKKYITPTVKFGGGSVFAWGCMSSSGAGALHHVDEIMDSAVYVDILHKEVPISTKKLFKKQKWVFQADNDPKHASKMAKAFVAEKQWSVMEWPPQSPDLSPIEGLWAYCKRHRPVFRSTNIKLAFAHIRKTWEKIPVTVCENLVASMPRRMEAVIKAQGGPIDY